MKIIAHRGASGDAPENTLAAISRAWDLNADGVEIDLRLSADGIPVVFHDADLKRITGCDLSVCEQTLSSLSLYDVGQWKGKKWEGERIPTFDEVLSRQPTDKILLIELKDGIKMVQAIKPVFESPACQEKNIWLMSFDLMTLRLLMNEHPSSQSLLLVRDPISDPSSELSGKIDDAQAAGAAGLGLSNAWLKYEKLINQVNISNLLLSVWTVNNTLEAQSWASLGAFMLTTDYPGRFIEKH